MAQNKSEHISELVKELLDDIELNKISIEAILLKTSRLARFVDSYETQRWIYFEMNGYRVNVEKDAPKGSGNAQVYSVYDHKEIGKVQHSPSTANLPTKQQSQHIGEYIKFTLKDGKVTILKVSPESRKKDIIIMIEK